MLTADLPSSELRYRRLFEAAHDGILIVDPHTRQIIDVNPFLEGFLGYTFEEFIGKELFEIGLLKDEAASQAAFRELRRSGFIRYDDLPLETKDGRRVDVEFVSNLYDEGDQQVIQCNIRDLSARKQADAALRQSEERFKLVARAVSDVIWDWDLVKNTLWWSDGFTPTTVPGYSTSKTELDSEWRSCRIHPDERRQVGAGIQQAIDAGDESWSAEYRFLRQNGSYALVHDNGYIVRDPAGKGVRMLGGIRDLTEQKELEARHLRAQRMESIGTLAGGIAHDLNNVLTPIMMSIELLKDDSSNDLSRKSILDTIDVSCRRGADLVRQVLTFARGLNGQRVAIRLRHLVDELRAIINETFPRNIKIVSEVPYDLWPIVGDPTQLHQVFINLAVNARDAMPQGGTLSLTLANIVLDAQAIGPPLETPAGRYILVNVSDTGIGIPPGIRERIFEPFFTTKEVGKGTGFGLATVHTVVKGHGGFLHVDSEVGRGTTFRVYLPADPALRTATSAPFLDDLPHGHDELVLVVDDEFSIRDITQRTLEAFGYRVITAREGTEAVALYTKQAQEIDVVLTDMMMPVMDGAATVEALKSINPSVKIIVVSGLEVSKPLKARVSDFLPKPYTARTLIKLVRDVLDRSPVLATC
jgi:PAS domain S-box-containing protein